jgi:protein-L-isoaspartate(D-aspartate) O-methyltransferase
MDGGEIEDRLAEARRRMVGSHLAGRDITDPGVLRVMGEVRREEFVPDEFREQAYEDNPLSIGLDQTISQPYIVALMTQELRLNSNCEVLEVGTGSGYQTAVLSRLAKTVYTIERFEQLAAGAQAALNMPGFSNIEFFLGDGSCGWPGERTFDRIIITAAVPKIPQPLIEQLAEGGLLVGPIGSGGVQELVTCRKAANKMIERVICGCRFVKLIGKYAFEK